MDRKKEGEKGMEEEKRIGRGEEDRRGTGYEEKHMKMLDKEMETRIKREE